LKQLIFLRIGNMKKLKIDFSKQAIQQFLFRHVEKVVLGVSVLLIGLFFLMGVKTPKFDTTTPAALMQTSSQAQAYINDASNWNKIADFEPRKPVVDAKQRIVSAKPLDAKSLQFFQLMGTAVRTLQKRTDPVFYAPGELVLQFFRAQLAGAKEDATGPQRSASGSRDSYASKLVLPADQEKEMFTSRIKGGEDQPVYVTEVVVGMALIDYEAQYKAYRDTFQYQRGYDENRDVPEYAFVEIQRRKEGSDEWVPIHARIEEIQEGLLSGYGRMLPEIVKTPLDWITMPILPFIGIDYRPFSALPEIDQKRPSDYAEQRRKKLEEEANKKKPPKDIFSQNESGKTGPDAAKEGEKTEPEEEPIERYRLIRFYDSDRKQTGEKYYYRVRLWILDPNNPDRFSKAVAAAAGGGEKGGLGKGGGGGGTIGADEGGGGGGGGDSRSGKSKEMTPLSLEDISPEVRERLRKPAAEVAGMPKWLEAKKELLRYALPLEWVECKAPVTIFEGTETFVAGPVVAPTPVTDGQRTWFEDDFMAQVVVNSFQNDLGANVPVQTKARPGTLLNFRAVAFYLHPMLRQIRQVYEQFDPRKRQKTGRYFESDAVVIDAMGGVRQPFSRKPDNFISPSEVMLLDRSGKLVLRNDLDDTMSYRHSLFLSPANLEALKEELNPPKEDDKKEGGDGGKGDS
jgi:hypothetical protein